MIDLRACPVQTGSGRDTEFLVKEQDDVKIITPKLKSVAAILSKL